MTARLSPRRAAARERDTRVKRAESEFVARGRAYAVYHEAWLRNGGTPSDETLVQMMAAARAILQAERAEDVQPSELPETIFECWGCSRYCRGRSDGAFFEEGWSRIRGIDGPNALCPACTADPNTGTLLSTADFPNWRIVPGHCIAEPVKPR